MGSALSLRQDFDGAGLRLLARQTRDANQARRLLSLASIYDGGSRADAARLGSVTVQIVRDWVVRFNARGPDGLINGKAPGGRAKLNDNQRQALAKIVERGPIPAVDGVVRWRRRDLAQWIFEEFRVSMDDTTVGRELKALGFAKISARPRHYAQNELEGDAFKKTLQPRLQRSGPNARRARISKSGGPMKLA
jgi:transposase